MADPFGNCRKLYLKHEKLFWGFVILIIMFSLVIIFREKQLISTSQTFGPVSKSSLGGDIPFDINLKLFCQPIGNYFSEDSDISCKFIAQSNKHNQFNVGITAIFYSVTDNKSVVNCTSTISGIGFGEEDCIIPEGRNNFELSAGDYRVNASHFTTSSLPDSSAGSSVVTSVKVGVIKSKEVVFRGTLHVMSSYEAANKKSQDGTTLTIFITLIFIIPSSILVIRNFINETVSQRKCEEKINF